MGDSLKRFLSYLCALAWLADNEVDEESAERVLPVVEIVFDFVQELGKLRGAIKLGLKDLNEINRLKDEFYECWNEVGEKFGDEPKLLKLLNKLFEEVKEMFDEPVLS